MAQRFTDIKCHLEASQSWPFPEVPAARIAENASPNTVDINGNDRHIEAPGNFQKTGLKAPHLACPRHPSFGKDTHQLPVFEGLSRLPYSVHERLRARNDGDHPRPLCQPPNQRCTDVLGVSDHANPPGHGQHDEHPIQPAYMVGNHDGAPFCGDVFQSHHAKAIHVASNPTEQNTNKINRRQPENHCRDG